MEETTQTQEENVEEQENVEEENIEEQEETYDPNQNNQQDPSYEENTQTQDQSDVLVEVTEIAAGEECTNGGRLVEAGVDSNENGVLDQHEITNSNISVTMKTNRTVKTNLKTVRLFYQHNKSNQRRL